MSHTKPHPARDRFRLASEALLRNYAKHPELIGPNTPSRIRASAIIELIDALRALIFPGFFGKAPGTAPLLPWREKPLEALAALLHEQITSALAYKGLADERNADSIVCDFLDRVPAVRDLLMTDVDAAFEGDPATSGKDEIILAYPGLYAIMVNRLAHELSRLGTPLIPRMMTECAHNRTGIDIHPGAIIGHHFFIDHGTGVVIGETTRIGNYVKIYQGVTLGALSTRGGRLLAGHKRHPTIEDKVTIYSGASILGGETLIGAGAVIGSNAFITQSVPAHTRVSVKDPELQFMKKKEAAVEFRQEVFWDYVI
ncbi:MAG: serine acetyltransferase [Zoogloeaceae bacterium]|jgi:serine O-acetyltransferase|nr:serine acetyltransferase [Zoogloeaceae bacterium]